MGNYSEVAIKCEKKAYEMLKETCCKVDCMPDKIYKDGENYILHWDWIEWYEHYKKISAVESVLNKLDKLQDPDSCESTGYGYKFMRIRESCNDIETRGNDFEIELYITQKIDIPNGLDEITV